MTWPASPAARTARPVLPPARPTPARTLPDPACPSLADLRSRKSAAGRPGRQRLGQPSAAATPQRCLIVGGRSGEVAMGKREIRFPWRSAVRAGLHARLELRGESQGTSRRGCGRRFGGWPPARARQGIPPHRRTSPRRSTQTPTDKTQKQPTPPPRRCRVAHLGVFAGCRTPARTTQRSGTRGDGPTLHSAGFRVTLPHASVHARLTS